ncbi:right-handed parallel beta-helix repeat-containing protein [Paenibacillus sp. Soil787]|uniref:right-handed parallel beta-helix repeat-containing protein n=1 Tax=Paenibacillus sp. Soil787 TaxID=1736411 RepID=UPI00138ED28C|nr:right-handed parallel beta-helix repeat-containing protein [Paenibacillus sp. Soil787]
MKRKYFMILLSFLIVFASIGIPFTGTALAAETSGWYKTTDSNNVEWLNLKAVRKPGSPVAGSIYGITNFDYALSDMVLQMDVKAITNTDAPNHVNISFFFGFKDINNHYSVIWNTDTGALSLNKRVNNVNTVLQTVTVNPFVKDTIYNVKITTLNNVIKVFLNGQETLSATDSQYTTGRVGLGEGGIYTTSNLTTAFGNFTIKNSSGTDLGGNIFVGQLPDWTFNVASKLTDINRVDEDFTYADGWKASNLSGWSTNADSLGAGYKAEIQNQSLNIESAGKGNTFYLKKLLSNPYSNTKVIVRYKMRADSAIDASDQLPALIDASGSIISQLKLSSNGQLQAIANGTTTTIANMTMVSGKEYYFGFVIDLAAKTLDITIGSDDGVKITVPTINNLPSNLNTLAGIMFQFDSANTHTAGNFALDDLIIEAYNTGISSFNTFFSTNTQTKIDYVPELQAKLPQGILFSKYSSDVYVNGARTKLDTTNNSIMPVVQGNDVLLPKDFMLNNLGAASVTGVTYNVYGKDYVSVTAGTNAVNQKIWTSSSGNLIAISNNPAPFTLPADSALLTNIEKTFGMYVSTQGNDTTGDGTYGKPFLTLDKARSTLGTLKNSGRGIPVGGITVYVMGGEYKRTASFSLAATDSGRTRAPITYKAYPGQSVSITGSKTIDTTKFTSVTDPAIISRLQPGMADKIVQVDMASLGYTSTDLGSIQRQRVNTGVDSPALLFDGKKQTIARWPNQGYSEVGKVLVPGSSTGGKWTYTSNEPDKYWKTADQMWAEGFWYNDWFSDSMQVDKLDTAAKTISVLQTTPYGMLIGQRYYVFNLLEELDVPGEWFLDRNTKILYFYAPSSMNGKNMQFTTLNTPLLTVSGSSNINFEGITFENTNQNDAQITNADKIGMKGNTFRNIGGQAIVIDTSTNIQIKDSDFYNLGKGGISSTTSGYRPTLAPANIWIENNYFTRFNTVTKTYAPAVNVGGVGVRVRNNMMSESDHEAIAIGGNNNIIENNEIYSVVKTTADAGAIYGGRDFTAQGNEIRNNLMHDIYGHFKGANGVYLDDSLSGFTIKNNIFFNQANPVFIHGGRDNTIDSNIIANAAKSMSVGLLGSSASNLTPPNGTLYTGYMQMPVSSDIWKSSFPNLVNYWSGTNWTNQIELPKDNTITKNVLYNAPDVKTFLTPEAIQFGTIANNPIVTDPGLFVDAAHNNFNLAKDPGIDGFTPPVVNEMGLKINNVRTSLPKIQDFNVTFPQVNAALVEASRMVFRWEPAVGASHYKLTVATDQQLNNVVFQDETDDPYMNVKGLEYGGKQYFWKVEATSGSVVSPDSKVNNSGVVSFTTALQAAPADTYELLNKLDEAKSIDATAVIGTDSQQFPAEAKAKFEQDIQSAENILKDSTATQDQIDTAVANLTQSIKDFKRKQIQGYADMGFLKDQSNWIGADPNAFTWTDGGNTLNFKPSTNLLASAGYNIKMPNSAILRFKAGFNFAPGEWVAFTLRDQNIYTYPWASTGYLIAVKADHFELQRFGAGGQFAQGIIVVPNTLIQSGTEHLVEFGALDVDNGVHIIFKIDGQVIYDYVDTNGYLPLEGYFGIGDYSNPTGLTLKAYDDEAPTTTAAILPSEPDGKDGWYAHPLTVSLNAKDNLSSVTQTVYSIDGGATWNPYTQPISFSKDGKYTLSYRSTDNSGNEEPAKSLSFSLDATAPVITVSAPKEENYLDSGDLIPQFTVTDDMSGVDGSKTVATLDGQNVQQGTGIPLYKLNLGSHTFTVKASDTAGNEQTTTVTFQTTANMESLKKLVERFAQNKVFKQDVADSLQDQLAKGDLNGFIKKVQGYSGKQISSDVANYLIRDARYVQKING